MKYNLHEIMCKAWKLYRKGVGSFAEALHRAWNSAKAAPINAQTPASPQIGYASARTGGGKFVVKDAAGNVAGSFMGSKAEADTEADRLNAGGEPINAQTPASEGPVVPPSTESGAPADGNSTGNLPDA